MILSIDVLPAPFGPMIARISPLRISNETSLTALTPPKDSDTFSTESSTSPTATSGPLGALMRRLRASYPCSCRLPHCWRRRLDLHIADFDPRLDHPFATILEGDLGGDVGFRRAAVQRLDQGRVALGDEAAADLLRTCKLAVVSVEFLVQDEETLDLCAHHHLVGGQRLVHFRDVLLDHVVDERMLRELLIGGVHNVIAFGPATDRG